MKSIAAVVIIVATLPGCAAVIRDWNTRPQGLHQNPEPSFMAWTVPRVKGVARGTVRTFFRVNHYAGELEAITRWNAGDPVAHDPEPDHSWVVDRPAGPGRHRMRIWIVRDGSTFFYADIGINVTDLRPGMEPARLD